MKKLNKMFINNWLFFKKQVVNFDVVNFLTGKNSAGKSTLIDAMQVVLLGEKSRIFNKAAADKGERKIDGYLYADDGSGQGSRRGHSFETYIVLEFYDNIKITNFTIGVIFECYAGGDYNFKYFIYDGIIPDNLYYENDDTMGISRLRNYLNDKFPHYRFFDTEKAYRDALIAKFNVQTERYFSMLKKAVAFDPITDIPKFITESICDIEDNIDIVKMQENVREYQEHLKIAEKIEKEIEMLTAEKDAFNKMLEALGKLRQQEYVVARAEKESCENELNDLQSDIKQVNDKIIALNSQINEIDKDVKTRERLIEELNNDPGLRSVEDKIKQLSQEIKTINDENERLRSEVDKEVSSINAYAGRLYNSICPLEAIENDEQLLKDIEQTKNFLDYLKTMSMSNFISTTPEFWHKYGQSLDSFMQKVRNEVIKSEDLIKHLKDEKSIIEEEIENLKKGQKPFDKGLLQFKADMEAEYLKVTGKSLDARFLCDAIEMREEDWHNAVEGFLGKRKFYLVFSPEKYVEANRIFKKIKNLSMYPIRLLGLVDIGKIREKEKLESLPNSLATKVETSDDLARTYIQYTLGRVICCENIDELRNYRTAIMRDGMLYQSYVQAQIPEDAWANPYIGKASLTRLLKIKEDKLKDIEIKIQKNSLRYRNYGDYERRGDFLSDREIDEQILPKVNSYSKIEQNQTELERLRKDRNSIDLTHSSKIKAQIDDLKAQNEKAREKHTTLIEQRQKCRDSIDSKNNRAIELNENLEQLSPRLEEATERISYKRDEIDLKYNNELHRFGSASVIVKNFTTSLKHYEDAWRKAGEELRTQRRNFTAQYPDCNFNIDNSSNEDYDKLFEDLTKLELPNRKNQIEEAKENAAELFRIDFVNQLYSNISTVTYQVDQLNKSLKRGKFGKDAYKFRADPNPDYIDFYNMIIDFGETEIKDLKEGPRDNLLKQIMRDKYKEPFYELMNLVVDGDEQAIKTYTDYRTYLKFDLEVTDENGGTQRLSKTLKSKSGGESQTPFYIAMVAAFCQLYSTQESGERANTVRIVMFDEAFSKMDSNRFTECINLFRKCGLQVVICAPDDKIENLSLIADETLYVHNENYNMQVGVWNKQMMEDIND